MQVVTRYVRSLLIEIDLWHTKVGPGPLEFIYFGGGTPSVLSPDQISTILNCLDTFYGLEPSAEVTLETHPTHATPDFLNAMKSAGVNRVSMGIQSFDEGALKRLGATHGVDDCHSAIRAASTVMNSFAIDLLYAYAGQSREGWLRDISLTMDRYEVPHLSCYALVPIDSECLQLSQESEVDLALIALSAGAGHGMQHYASCASGGFDISLPDRRCRYETGHWAAPQRTFLGLGPGAFGFVGGHTTVNGLSIDHYASNLQKGQLPLASAVPVLTTESQHRYFVLGVKALDVPLGPYRTQFHSDPHKDFQQQFLELERNALAVVDDEFLHLSPLGRLYVDSCSALFFSANERAIPHPEEPEIRLLERAHLDL
jgi:oxygen-independent coproporphyrinogen III oxidase